ncbi:hypothetical protein RRG08_036845, partial [Elysia crispata]
HLHRHGDEAHNFYLNSTYTATETKLRACTSIALTPSRRRSSERSPQ